MPKEEQYLRGNENLKKPNIPEYVTENQQQEYIEELIKCREDIIYFAEKYFTIISPAKGKHKIKLYDKQKTLLRAMVDRNRVISLASRQVGKALDVHTPILTPDGFKKLNNLKVDDTIYGRDGKETTIKFITETMYDHTVYDVEFDNGEIIKADKDHIWTVGYSGCKDKRIDLTTSELVPFIDRKRKQGIAVFVDVCNPIEYDKKQLPIDPYTLGVWLGDGNKCDGRITCYIDDYQNYEDNFPYDVDTLIPDNRSKFTGRFNVKGLNKLIRENNLKNNKHIPSEYIRSSIEDRIELIRGLMDSDGYIPKKGNTCQFYQKNEEFIDNVRFILSTLGVKSTKSVRMIKECNYYTLTFTPYFNPFKLKRKYDRYNPKFHPKLKRHYFVSINECDSVPVKCIQVDNEDHLFLAGETLIPTHNTTTYTIYALHQTIFFPEQKILIAANKKDTALEILGRIQMAYECLPNWIKPGLLEYNKGNMKFSNLSAISGVATGSSSARGSSANILILDEFSFVPHNVCRDFWNSVYPVISSSKTSKVIVVSTPNGVGNLYHVLWEKSQTGEKDDEGQGWYGVRIDWWDVPGRDDQWKRQQIDALGAEDFEQEFGNSFLSSSTPKLINDRLMKKFRIFLDEHEDFGKFIHLDMYRNIENDVEKEFKIRIYHEYRENRSYLISFDVGEGVGKDSSVAYVWDVTDMSNILMCAKFSDNKTATNEFAYILSKLYHFYGRPWLAGEANSIGKSVIDLLINLYHVENHVMMNKGGSGIFSHAQSKSKACRFAKNLMGNPEVDIKLYDTTLIDEMEWFVQKDTSKHVLFEALPGKHDDHMMALIWALYVLNEKDIENYFSIMQYSKTLIGETLPLYLQSLVNPVEINFDTLSILDLDWRKQKQSEDKYINNKVKEHIPNKLEYFQNKPRSTGVLGMMERTEMMEDAGIESISSNAGEMLGYFGGMEMEW